MSRVQQKFTSGWRGIKYRPETSVIIWEDVFRSVSASILWLTICTALGWWLNHSCCWNYYGNNAMSCVSHMYLFLHFWNIKKTNRKKENRNFHRGRPDHHCTEAAEKQSPDRIALFHDCRTRWKIFTLPCSHQPQIFVISNSKIIVNYDWVLETPLRGNKLIISNVTHNYQTRAYMVPMRSTAI